MATKITKAPIVLIHGIKGSHLAQTYDDSFDVIWSGVQHRFESIRDLELDETGEVEVDPKDLLSVMKVEKIAYGELMGRLRKKFHNVPAYIFRYDWRLDLKNTAKKFDEFLELLEKKTGRHSFRIVTHSMGGLILSAFLKMDIAKNLKRVEKAVLTATPFWGSIEVLRTLVAGETVGLGFNAPESYRKIARTFPSAYQLVPGYPGAWDHPEAGATIWDTKYWQKRVVFQGRDKEKYKDRDKLMQSHLSRAKEFHDDDVLDFDNDLSNEERKRFLVLYGVGEKTKTKVKVTQKNSKKDIKYFFNFNHGVDKRGDGTVPEKSVLRYKKIPRIAVELSDFKAWWPWLMDDKVKLQIAGYHGMFLALDKVQGLVCDWFEGKSPKPSWAKPIKP